METTDMCFAYILPELRGYSNESCKALSCGCPGYDVCPFYKSTKRYLADREAVNARLRSLPAEKQCLIATVYYNGDMPWRFEDEIH